ncbi:tagatose kinase [Rhizobium halophytocola]|uniref:Sugar/nucleoside kinase (Ribokinase family) n=1 Tax=Rhizobium halophytocola TaxID=735519 RepID=A0ABS4DUJ0_9HYPH|nr:sugar kinase [Rhizobium halophytocola]MBP1849337.1 sugar/nucleoside kinase (ribokinase family) [Rhizobium halophytocola]
MTKILTIGEILVEIIATEKGDGFRAPVRLIGPFPSGAPAIFIDQVGKLGTPCAIISRVGDDDFGHVNLARLKADGVDVSGVEVDPQGTTGSAFVRYRNDGSRAFVFNIRHSACGTITLNDDNRRLIGECTHLHVMGTALYGETVIDSVMAAIENIKARGGTVSFDPNLRPETLKAPGMREALSRVLTQTDLFLPSGEELFLFAAATEEEAAVEELLATDIKAVVLKRGAKGASYFDATTRISHPGFVVEEHDPTGAGDSFGATFVSFWLEGAAPAVALAQAAASGALAVTKVGPMEGTSTRAELQALISAAGEPS